MRAFGYVRKGIRVRVDCEVWDLASTLLGILFKTGGERESFG